MHTASAGNANDNRTALGIACGMGAGALWGLVFLAPELVRDFTPLQLAIGRYLAYGVIAATLIAPRWRGLAASISRRDWIALAWLSLAGNTLYYVLLSTAVQTGGIAMTSLVIGFLPVAVTIIGSRDHGAVPLAKLVPSLLLCAAGAMCIGWQAITAPASGDAGRQLVGLACAIGALMAWTAYAVGNARCLTRLDQVSIHDWNLLTGLVTGAQALFLIPVSLAFEPIRHAGIAWAQFAGVSVAVAVAASIMGNALWNRMSRLLPLTMVGQMILFETLFALLYGFLWEQRLPLPLEVAAFVLVVASVLSCIAAHRRHPRDAAPSQSVTGEQLA
ncbi:DMT family transporter [Novosphingobium mathurense]|uniref:Permease of the drug/metabolite transporter (DMT) superfamily n=1 Tax=Novosphingobium mathurense TaxID=428990 RepID=A0A1U6IYQ9_9SPHN|nr:DMT family transporter [Novosphingobium mathurense]SLK13147.1 Permease of the drug/metabolite transporter (DMT) superfamily [Novosphingobium mathurense]